jgi:hypothetical protein
VAFTERQQDSKVVFHEGAKNLRLGGISLESGGHEAETRGCVGPNICSGSGSQPSV